MKKCSRCKLEKKVEEFSKNKVSKDGFKVWCRRCGAEVNRKYRITHPEQYRQSYRRRNANPVFKKYATANQRLRLYGMTSEEFDQMFVNQGKKCGICGSLDPQHNKGWNVDHDHKTGEVRGILCGVCNTSLGGFKDNPNLLQAAIEYLK